MANPIRTDELVVELYSTDLVPQLLDFYELCYKKRLPERHFFWKHLESPFGTPAGASAKSALTGELVGFYGAVQEGFYYKGKPITIYQSGDSMTHPDFRKRGIFETLGNKTYDHLIAKKEMLTHMLSNTTSMAFHVRTTKLGWRLGFPMKPYFKIMPQLKAEAALSFSNPKNWPVRIEWTQTPPPQLNDFDAHLGQTRPLALRRTQEVVRWRCSQPGFESEQLYLYDKNERLEGYAIIRYEPAALSLIMDFEWRTDSPFAHKLPGWLLHLLQKKAIERGGRGLYTWTSPGGMFEKVLKKHFYFQNPFNKGPLHDSIRLCLRDNNVVAPSDFLNRPENWEITPFYYDS